MTDFPVAISRKYRPVKILGEGGFGTVWQAVQLDLNRPVALKVLSEKALTDADAVARFRHEALVASKINHPGVVAVLDYGVEGSLGYIALPLIDGCTLRDRIRQGPMPTSQAMLVAIALADALAEIHRQGVIHRDLKPENVLMENRERPLLTDFGISKSAGSSVQTREGIIFGTPGYVAPEQLEHEKASPASDQFSLAVIVYELLTGRRPFTGDTPAEEAMARVKSPPYPIRSLLPRLAPEVAEVLMKMLARDPGQRYKDMRAVHRALQVAALKATASEKEPAPPDRQGRRTTGSMAAVPGPDSSQDTPGGARMSRSLQAPMTVSMTRIPAASRPARYESDSRRSLPRALVAAAAVLLVLAAAASAWLLRPRDTAAPPPAVAVSTPEVPAQPPPTSPPPPPAAAELVLPAVYPRIASPDCAKLEGKGGHITPLDVARCEVRRWFSAWDKVAGRTVGGHFSLVVAVKKASKDASTLLELFESAPARRALEALAYLRDSAECQAVERFDAGVVLIRAHAAHAACLWNAFGANLGPDAKFPFPNLFSLPAGGFYSAWERQWKLASGWEQQASALGEWVTFHRALEEERILWTPGTAHASALGGATAQSLLREDLGYVMTRLWRLRTRGQHAEALALWTQAESKLRADGPGMAAGKRSTLSAWVYLEGFLLAIFSKNLGAAQLHAAEARKALALCREDRGAARLAIAGWGEWKQLGSLGQ
ncbi:MAG: serine/threonine protein kinase [Candidatus Wallbacteria bacterium]|nr:serine/threonine protein kinase [Candidatus Wallbacteria bacterium]